MRSIGTRAPRYRLHRSKANLGADRAAKRKLLPDAGAEGRNECSRLCLLIQLSHRPSVFFIPLRPKPKRLPCSGISPPQTTPDWYGGREGVSIWRRSAKIVKSMLHSNTYRVLGLSKFRPIQMHMKNAVIKKRRGFPAVYLKYVPFTLGCINRFLPSTLRYRSEEA